jgi:hypothetical protein
LGRYQTLTLTDEIKDKIVATIKSKKEFAHFKQFDRYKDYLICRVEPLSPQESTANKQQFRHKALKQDNSQYRFGDVRVLFEVVPCDKVSLSGQQI